MDAELIRRVRERARHRCEYCQLPQAADERVFEIDHVIARKHGGRSDVENLALSCFRCNSFKGSDIASLDPESEKLTPLFNPRSQAWTRHFQWDGPWLVGRTAAGRVTVFLLQINDASRVDLRKVLIDEGVFPPG